MNLNIAAMNNLYPKLWLVFACCCCYCCCCVACSRSNEESFVNDVQQISIDLSPDNPERVVEQDGFYAGETSINATDDKAISPNYLATLMWYLQIDDPALELVMPSPDWVFYIGHNGKSSTQVMLYLTGDLDVMLDGKKHTEAVDLTAGAHGFKVVRQENVIKVEHVFDPYTEPQDCCD